MTDTSGDSEFDVVDLVERLKLAGEERKRVVALRPSAEQLADSSKQYGDPLSQFGEASRQLAAAKLGVDPAQKSSWFPLSGSVAQADRDSIQPSIEQFCEAGRESYHWLATNPTRNPSDWTLGYVARCFKTVTENVHAVGALTDTGRHLRAPLTLMRSIIEASASACFVMDIAVNERERLRRGLNLHLAQTKEALLESAGLDHSGQYSTELAEVMEFAKSCDSTFRRYNTAKWNPRWLHQRMSNYPIRPERSSIKCYQALARPPSVICPRSHIREVLPRCCTTSTNPRTS